MGGSYLCLFFILLTPYFGFSLEGCSEPSASGLGSFLRQHISSSESNYELLTPQPQFIHYTSHNWPLLSALFSPSRRIRQLLSELTPARSISQGEHTNSIIAAGPVWWTALRPHHLPLHPLLCSDLVTLSTQHVISHIRTHFLVLSVIKMFACEIFINPSPHTLKFFFFLVWGRMHFSCFHLLCSHFFLFISKTRTESVV